MKLSILENTNIQILLNIFTPPSTPGGMFTRFPIYFGPRFFCLYDCACFQEVTLVLLRAFIDSVNSHENS